MLSRALFLLRCCQSCLALWVQCLGKRDMVYIVLAKLFILYPLLAVVFSLQPGGIGWMQLLTVALTKRFSQIYPVMTA